jgi:hypothetical protein
MEIELREAASDAPVAIGLLETARAQIGARQVDQGAAPRKPAEAMSANREVLVAYAGASQQGWERCGSPNQGVAEIKRL